MSAFHDNALMGASGQQGYKISRSVRFRSSASAYFNRTFGSGSRTTWTWSCWIKRGAVGVVYPTTNYAQTLFGLNDSDKLYFYEDALWLYLGTGATYVAQPTDKFRDPSAWYHIVVVLDTTNATSADRIRMYVNNRRITISQTMPTQNWASSNFNSAIIHNIGKADNSNLYYLDGYLTEIQFIDGQALTPSSFGETDTTTGVWKPKKYTGTYGTNGFYLNFSDNSNNTAATIGKDYSGNGNNWTPNNISVTAGTTYDSMVDSPTVGATSSNYAVLNPLSSSSYITLSGANLNTQGNTATDEGVCGSTIAVKTGKFYAEFVVTGSIVSNRPNYGIIPNPNANFTNGGAQFANTGGMRYGPDGKVYTSGSLFGTFSTFTTNDIISIAVDADNGAAYVAKNGTWQNSGVPTSGSSKTGAVVTWTGGAVEYFICVDEYNGTTSATNFGQRPFTYTPPTGFVALNTQNLPTPTISNGAQYMAASTYTGTGATQSIVNSGNNAAGISFQPDFVWIKDRSAARSHRLFDAVRGATKALFSDATDAETTLATDLTAFNSNGFTLGAGAGSNSNTETFVGWQWKASGSTVSNTSGSITSTVSVGATQGFSVVTYTGTGANATVGHGLGVAPAMTIVKRRNAVQYWAIWHNKLTSYAYELYFNTSDAQALDNSYTANPSSTVLSLGSGVINNASGGTYVAYCFSEVAGYSKFGSYTGNGSADGPFVYCGFRPRFLLWKRTDAAADWGIFDTSRDPYNGAQLYLAPDLSAAESNIGMRIDLVSNGFKIRTINDPNASGGTYIFMAFAENPFKNSLAR